MIDVVPSTVGEHSVNQVAVDHRCQSVVVVYTPGIDVGGFVFEVPVDSAVETLIDIGVDEHRRCRHRIGVGIGVLVENPELSFDTANLVNSQDKPGYRALSRFAATEPGYGAGLNLETVEHDAEQELSVCFWQFVVLARISHTVELISVGTVEQSVDHTSCDVVGKGVIFGKSLDKFGAKIFIIEIRGVGRAASYKKSRRQHNCTNTRYTAMVGGTAGHNFGHLSKISTQTGVIHPVSHQEQPSSILHGLVEVPHSPEYRYVSLSQLVFGPTQYLDEGRGWLYRGKYCGRQSQQRERDIGFVAVDQER